MGCIIFIVSGRRPTNHYLTTRSTKARRLRPCTTIVNRTTA
jgi:hypothetical protein